MQDYNYVFADCFEITPEIGCEKYPGPERLPDFWRENRASLIEYLAVIHHGIGGFVRYENGTVSSDAVITVRGNDKTIKSGKYGEYMRLLAPGEYDLRAEAGDELKSKWVTFNLPNETHIKYNFTLLSSEAEWNEPETFVYEKPEDNEVIDEVPLRVREKIVIIDNEESEEEIGTMFHLSRFDNDKLAIAEAITITVNGEDDKRAESDQIKIPINEPSTVTFTSASYYKVTKYVQATDKHIKVRLHPLPTSVGYHSHEEMLDTFTRILKTCPKIAKTYDIGKSVKGKTLRVLKLSSEFSHNERNNDIYNQEIKLVGGIHGNEVIGRESLINLAEYMCNAYGNDDFVTKVIDTTDINFYPSMNPDGFEIAIYEDEITGRENINNVDLNRNFPDQFGKGPGFPTQPETDAVMKWTKSHWFTASISLHGGSLVACYPFDGTENGKNTYSKSPDDETFVYLAKSYANAHPTMWKGELQCDGDRFKDGISNGADWYSLYGGMQDWNYLQARVLEITIEMGCTKYPRELSLLQSYHDHYPALMAHIANAKQGFYGNVTDTAGNPIRDAKITSPDLGIDIFSRPDGQFWRVAAPGNYTVTFSADGFQPHEHHVHVGVVNWRNLSAPHNIQLLYKGQVEVKERGSTLKNARRYTIAGLICLAIIISTLIVASYRRRKQQQVRSNDVEAKELINSDTDDD